VNETVQLVQQFVCVLPLTSPVKHVPPTAVPPASSGLVAPASASVPVEPDITKKAVPLGGLGGTCQDSSTSVLETVLTVMVAAELLLPDSVLGEVFWNVPVKVAL
jgi:hypothetical protein